METKGALTNLKVLDLTRVLAGPFCTMILADMGADVIKIERADSGDDTRSMGPFLNGESAYYMNLNRNKRGMTLNLKDPQGKELFLEMVKKADIVTENFRPGTMENLGIGYETLKEINPRIIYAAISGFGHTGPYKMRPGYDIIAQAMSGLMSTTGWPGGEPTRTGTAMGDVLAGLSCAIGILAAVNARNLTGVGQKVDIALVDSAVASLEIINMIYLIEGRIPQRIGNRYESTYPYDSFKASDGSLVIGAANNKLWKNLCSVMERPELAEAPEYLEVKDRVARNEELKVIVEEWTTKHTVQEAFDLINDAGIPCAPIMSIDQIVKDPHIAGDREMFVKTSHPIAGELTITGSHIKLSDTPPTIRTHSPLLGEHNVEILKELLDMDEEEVKELERRKIL
ncbi:CoA transferase [Aminobacterium sp. MB27-C1]|uniref:CaiB/BaiF CoA transferase family protein n=1 Tax=Aminobacterium sp. MB27-C1 TaxID=3070661 RepID=UPI001BCCAA47|nr:CoA transferase [Aminobacterium sp. MB27-C1]MDD2247621.1 CoA transferase [Proteiniphilum sp.]MDD4229734.1 CoA transferase [Aminobacterium sp.]WMI72192.1 CoA transferase [Aminobacterium sp. MB27-C1]